MRLGVFGDAKARDDGATVLVPATQAATTTDGIVRRSIWNCSPL
jgi:hypothetical protein